VIASSIDNWVGLALAIAAVAYLVLVLVFPERF
jgi:K+-transporting ATPase KdpF subunit